MGAHPGTGPTSGAFAPPPPPIRTIEKEWKDRVRNATILSKYHYTFFFAKIIFFKQTLCMTHGKISNIIEAENNSKAHRKIFFELLIIKLCFQIYNLYIHNNM